MTSARNAISIPTLSFTCSTAPPTLPLSLQKISGTYLEKSHPISSLFRPSANFRLLRRFLLGKDDGDGLLRSRLHHLDPAVMVAFGAHQFGYPAGVSSFPLFFFGLKRLFG